MRGREYRNRVPDSSDQGKDKKELQAHTELAEAYFSRQMQERERLFRSASAVLEKAIEQGNVEIAQIALRTIEIVHHKSPFSF